MRCVLLPIVKFACFLFSYLCVKKRNFKSTMNKILCLIITPLAMLACSQSTTWDNNNNANQPLNSISPPEFFSLSDAEKILGEPAHLADNLSSVRGDVSVYSRAYIANAQDLKSGKTGAVYFLFEQYA